MDFNLLLRNRGVHRVLVGVPEGAKELAARIETGSGDIITLQESTLAALARAYLSVTTHPTLNAVELVATAVTKRKDGFAEMQLLDALTDEAAIRRELASGPPLPLASLDELATPCPATTAPATGPGHSAPSALATEHGHPAGDEDDDLDLELDEDSPEEEVLFGDIPTHHSKPRSKR